MKKLLLILFSLFALTAYSQEVISEFNEETLPVLNEELRKLDEDIDFTGDVTGSGKKDIALTIETGAVGADELASTAVTAGDYTHTSLTVDEDGRITAASSGEDTCLSNVIFAWSGNEAYSVGNYGMQFGADLTPEPPTGGYLFYANDTFNYQTFLHFKFTKIASVSSVALHARLWAEHSENTRESYVKVDIGGQNTEVHSITSTTPTWYTAGTEIDVSGLTNGTTYNGIVQHKAEGTNFTAYCSAVTLIGS